MMIGTGGKLLYEAAASAKPGRILLLVVTLFVALYTLITPSQLDLWQYAWTVTLITAIVGLVDLTIAIRQRRKGVPRLALYEDRIEYTVDLLTGATEIYAFGDIASVDTDLPGPIVLTFVDGVERNIDYNSLDAGNGVDLADKVKTAYDAYAKYAKNTDAGDRNGTNASVLIQTKTFSQWRDFILLNAGLIAVFLPSVCKIISNIWSGGVNNIFNGMTYHDGFVFFILVFFLFIVIWDKRQETVK